MQNCIILAKRKTFPTELCDQILPIKLECGCWSHLGSLLPKGTPQFHAPLYGSNLQKLEGFDSEKVKISENVFIFI